MEDKKVLNNIETVFEVEFDSDREAEIVYNAIYPELSFSHNDRSTTDIKLDNNNMIITINSKSIKKKEYSSINFSPVLFQFIF